MNKFDTEFKYINGENHDIGDMMLEIAHQLKRIADSVEIKGVEVKK